MLTYIFVFCLWFSTADALYELLSDEQLVASPFIRQLVQRLEVLEQRDRNQQQQIDSLEAEVAIQRKDIQQLHNSADDKDRQILELINAVRKQEPEKEKQADQDDYNVIKRSNPTMRMRRESDSEITVAFFSGLSHVVQHAGVNQNIVFDHVETNEGNAYNPHYGVFTAPVEGIYVFTTTIMTMSGRKVCEMLVNGVRKAQIYTHGDGHYDHSSQTIIFHLKKGDDVAIQHNSEYAIYGESVPYTTFSGFLLKEIFSDPAPVVG